jgi:acetyltransferase-like isoleucine patch superfamily enzyme
LRSTGVTIGKNCSISLRAKIDTRRGKIIIGNNCTITYNCIILAHDRSASHINPEDDGEGVVVIEDGVYVGVNSVILRNVRIGKNSVIGAGSVVNRNVPEGVVAVGNPIRIVRTIEHLKNSTGRP